MSELEQRWRELERTLPWRIRLSLRVRAATRSMLRAVPGYRSISWLLVKAKRGGWAGVFEPPFNISKQNYDAHDKRLRWHGWGVLADGATYIAVTPTRRFPGFATTAEAWGQLERIYWGRSAPVQQALSGGRARPGANTNPPTPHPEEG